MSGFLNEHRGWMIAVAVVTVAALATWWLVADGDQPAVAIDDAAGAPRVEVSSSSPTPAVTASTTASDASPTTEPSASPGPRAGTAPSEPSVAAASPSPSLEPSPEPSPPSSPSPVPTAALTVTVEVDRAHYYAGEQVVASAQVCNDSGHRHTYRTWRPDPWTFAAMDSNGQAVATNRGRPSADDDGGPYTQTFEPGECRQASWTWDRQLGDPSGGAAAAGSYRVDAKYDASTVAPENRDVSGHDTSGWFVLHDEPRPDVEPSPETSPRPGPITVSVTTDRQVYDQGQVVRFVVEVCNTSQEVQHHESSRAEPVEWMIGYTTPVGDNGSRIDHYASSDTPPGGSSETVTTTFEPGQCRSYPYQWDQVVQHAMDDDPRGARPGEQAPAGEYVIEAYWDIHRWYSDSSEQTFPHVSGSTTFTIR